MPYRNTMVLFSSVLFFVTQTCGLSENDENGDNTVRGHFCNCTQLTNNNNNGDSSSSTTMAVKDANLEPGQILAMLSYAPIALLAENLRLQSALVTSILRTPGAGPPLPPLTGCVRDLGRVWNLNESDLYGDFGSGIHFVAVSLRHGNSFPLANKHILELAGIINRNNRGQSMITASFALRRPTIVNVSFVLPAYSENEHRRSKRVKFMYLWACRAIVTVEALMITASIAACAFYKFNMAVLLLSCVVSNTVALKLIERIARPVYGNASAQYMDSQKKVPGGAALDVHLVTRHWNSETIDVICGYSSQLHALTNIPVRTNIFWIVAWTARFTVLVLVVQAAALASLLGNNTIHTLASFIWMAFYVMMQIPERALLKFGLVTNVLEDQPADVRSLPPIQFSGRLAALAFIANLPVSHRADPWAWSDAFMPNNPRRREWQERVEACKMNLELPKDDKAELPEVTNDSMILEVCKILSSSEVAEPLASFRHAVGLQST